MSSRKAPKITPRWDGWLLFDVPYDPDWVEVIKEIPLKHREWDAAKKRWAISPSYAAEIRDWTLRFFGAEGSKASSSTKKRATADPFAVLHLLPSAPAELVDSAYRCLAKLAHPDRGGTHEQMLELTAAHDAAKAKRVA